MDDHLPRPLIKNIAFFGDADAPKNSHLYKSAYNIANIVAKEGYTIVNGGGPGVMDAATKGAEEGGGETLTVTFYPENATGFEGRYVGNVPDIEIKTTNYIERMFKLIEHADLYIIFQGGTGTISELGTAWVLAKLYYGHHKPFILYGDRWTDLIESIKKTMNISQEELDVFEIVTEEKKVLPTIEKFEKKLMEIDHTHCRVCREKAFMT